MPLNHIPVSSSALKSVAYDGIGTLEVITTNGNTYRYGGVSPETFSELMSADSVGKYWNAHIKGKYATDTVPPPSNDDRLEPA